MQSEVRSGGFLMVNGRTSRDVGKLWVRNDGSEISGKVLLRGFAVGQWL